MKKKWNKIIIIMESLLNGKRFFCREWAFQEAIISRIMVRTYLGTFWVDWSLVSVIKYCFEQLTPPNADTGNWNCSEWSGELCYTLEVGFLGVLSSAHFELRIYRSWPKQRCNCIAWTSRYLRNLRVELRIVPLKFSDKVGAFPGTTRYFNSLKSALGEISSV